MANDDGSRMRGGEPLYFRVVRSVVVVVVTIYRSPDAEKRLENETDQLTLRLPKWSKRPIHNFY